MGRQDAQGRICRAHRFSCDRGFICDMVVVSTVIERRAVGWDGGVGALGYKCERVEEEEAERSGWRGGGGEGAG